MIILLQGTFEWKKYPTDKNPETFWNKLTLTRLEIDLLKPKLTFRHFFSYIIKNKFTKFKFIKKIFHSAYIFCHYFTTDCFWCWFLYALSQGSTDPSVCLIIWGPVIKLVYRSIDPCSNLHSLIILELSWLMQSLERYSMLWQSDSQFMASQKLV